MTSDPNHPRERPPGTDAAVYKVLADPTRLAMLRLMMSDAAGTWSVKQLAARLSAPTTKLYRHIKQLEDCGLVQVAETRLVSGILEKRYRATQLDLQTSAAAGNALPTADLTRVVTATFDEARNQIAVMLATGRARLGPPSPQHPGGAILSGTLHLTRARFAELHRRLVELLDEFHHEDTAADPIDATLFAAIFADTGTADTT